MIFSFQCSTLTCDLHFSLFQQGIIITTSLPPPILSMSLSYIQLLSATISTVIGFSCSVTFSHLHTTQMPSMLHCHELSSRFYSVVTINVVFIPIIKYHQQTHLFPSSPTALYQRFVRIPHHIVLSALRPTLSGDFTVLQTFSFDRITMPNGVLRYFTDFSVQE